MCVADVLRFGSVAGCSFRDMVYVEIRVYVLFVSGWLSFFFIFYVFNGEISGIIYKLRKMTVWLYIKYLYYLYVFIKGLALY